MLQNTETHTQWKNGTKFSFGSNHTFFSVSYQAVLAISQLYLKDQETQNLLLKHA